MIESVDFIHLHNHSEYSALDGMPKVEEYVIKANKLGMKGLALTEHGNMRSVVQLYMKSSGKFEFQGEKFDLPPIKPIAGVEFYMSPNSHKIKGLDDALKMDLKAKCSSTVEYKEKLKELETKYKIRKRYHMLVFAKNNVGYENLLNLNFLAWRDGFYYRPRIDIELLKQYSEGLVATTSCIGGTAPNLILDNKYDESYLWLKEMKKVFKDDIYIEIQPHNIDEQRIANVGMIQMANELKIKVVATNDCHYLNKDDWESHNVLLAIQSRKPLQSADAWRFADNEFYLKSKAEMFETFEKNHPDVAKRDVKIALENTMEVYDKCNITMAIDKKQGILPKVNIPKEFKTPNNFLISLCKDGWKWREIKTRSQKYAKVKNITEEESYEIYKDRLRMELKRISSLKFEKYFLIIHELIWWARKNDILVGPGRGSSSGSMVCYLLGITSVDPIEYDLLFDRFLNESRIDYPDVDMDFEDTRRKEIFKHLFDKYGEKHVSLVGTFGRLKGKQALQDVGRVLDIPHSETSAVTKHIIIRSGGDARANQSVEDSFKEFDVCKQYDKKYPAVLPFVKRLEGKIRQVGIHACGIQLSPMVMEKFVPTEFREIKNPDEIKLWGTNRLKVSAIDWKDSQDLGLVKIDVLGLKTLSVLKEALKAVEKRYNRKIDLEKIDLEDKNILGGFSKGDFVGIFQFDSIGMTKTCEKLTFTRFEDVISLNALYRPGAMRSGLAQHFINRKIGKEKIEKLHPIYDNITKDTLGILVYQEQLIKCFTQLANYHPGTADEIRKAVAKSFGVEFINKQKDIFIAGAGENGMSKKMAEELFENISFFGSYAFNKAHAAAYSVIAYWGMYLKVYYPTEFYYALMKNESELAEILRYVIASRKNGVDVEIADINMAGIDFKIKDDKTIISGLVDIKGCGEKASKEISDKQPYSSLNNMLSKVNRRQVHRGVVGALIKAGAFRSLYPNMGALLLEIDYKDKRERKSGDLIEKPVWEWMVDLSENDGDELYNKYDTPSIELDEEQQVRIMSDVCPIPPYKHKLEYYSNTISKMFRDRTNFELYVQPDENYDHEIEHGELGLGRTKGIFTGILVDIKYNNVGDFHKEEPDKKEKQRIGWGKRYANVNIDNIHGIKRVNTDIYTFPTYRHIIDKGLQTPVLIVGTLMKWSEVINADMIIDLDHIREIMDKNISLKEKYKQLLPQEKYLIKHPCSFFKDRATTVKELKYGISEGTRQVVVLITKVKNHWTKKNKKMMFVELEDETSYLSTIAWPECVIKHSKKIQPGTVIRMYIKKNKDGYFIDERRKMVVEKIMWEQVGSTAGDINYQ